MSCLSTQSYISLICLFNIQGTGGSTSVGGVLRSTPETRSPTTPIHGGGGGRGGGLGGSAAASSDDLSFGGLGGDDLGFGGFGGARRSGT